MYLGVSFHGHHCDHFSDEYQLFRQNGSLCLHLLDSLFILWSYFFVSSARLVPVSRCTNQGFQTYNQLRYSYHNSSSAAWFGKKSTLLRCTLQLIIHPYIYLHKLCRHSICRWAAIGRSLPGVQLTLNGPSGVLASSTVIF